MGPWARHLPYAGITRFRFQGCLSARWGTPGDILIVQYKLWFDYLIYHLLYCFSIYRFKIIYITFSDIRPRAMNCSIA